ncbi:MULTISPECIES: Dps family protein [Dietzia]|nr:MULTISPECIES: DNA starvation/stationary phase protection protein [Dietzia]KZO58949.1 DNA starvation/stationary phase protection protein [Dietzia maris]MCT1712235.1 DNA starvation/stationary phase protection protein [Dietzia cinnamea]MCT2098955.1 DNA starvation/stationary phase protection protein [Dietzia cinnamea]MCT2120908.1 DNA starvation/stationary phase protection protein [Dietzia cinnamea]MCT2145145.1 DNA starvation/stationary phase protection protein [Dietzia cinnamea]
MAADSNGLFTSFVPAEAQEAVTNALQESLVDLIDLSLVAKQAHWSVVGPRFRSIHLALDEVVADARTFVDEVAERATAVGVSPDGRSATVAANSALDEVSAEFTSDDKVVLVMTEALEAAIKRLRANIGKVGDDPVTEDLLIGISARLEQLHWMWQAQSV